MKETKAESDRDSATASTAGPGPRQTNELAQDPARADDAAGSHPQGEAPAGSASTPKDEEIPVAGFLIMGAIGYVVFWNAVSSWQVRTLVSGAVAIGVAIWVIWISKRGQGQSAWDSFKQQARLLAGLSVTVLGAPTLAILLSPSDRAIAFKLATVVLLSFAPAWLYWQFIAGKGRALWDEFVIHLYRLGVDHPIALPRPSEQSVFYALWQREHVDQSHDPKVERRDNLYRKKFEGVYGKLTDDVSQRVLAENAMPVVLATVLFSLGWVLVLQPESVFSRTLFGTEIRLAPSRVPLDEIGFAFLGAYFYALQMLMRRYYQNDLKTSAYINVAVRVIIVVLLTWILTEVWTYAPAAEGSGGAGEGVDRTAAWRYGIAFTIGVFPDVGWQLLQKALKVPARWVDDSFRVRYPLSQIDGLNLWYQSRLLEEGIEDMQTLVTANLVDVMLHTRIPMDRLVDWLDQAVLLLHLPEDAEGKRDEQPSDPEVQSARAMLRRLGIRKAMELLSVYEHRELRFRLPALSEAESGAGRALQVLVAVAEAVRREPVLHYVVHWKSFPETYLVEAQQAGSSNVGRLEPPPADMARRSLGIQPAESASIAVDTGGVSG
jgi:hypothetical protein